MANPNIILSGRTVNPLQVQSQVQALEQNQLASQLSRMKMDELNRGVQRENQLRSLLAGGAGADQLITSGFVDDGLKMRKSAADVRETTAKAAKAEFDIDDAKRRRFMEFMTAGIGDPTLTKQKLIEMTEQEIANGFQDPAIARAKVRSLPDDPEELRRAMQTALISMTTAEQRAVDAREQARLIEARRNNDLDAQTQRRGQDMTDRRARESNDTQNLARLDAKEQVRTQKLAETKEKAVTKFSDTLQREGIPDLEAALASAEATFQKYDGKDVPGIGPLKNALPAAAMSAEGRAVRSELAAVRNIVLSARSGAAVTDQELRRLVEEIGTGVGMTDKDIQRGIKRIRDRFELVKANAAAGVTDDILNEYTQRGGVSIKRGKTAAGRGATESFDAPAGGGIKFLGFE